MRRAVAVGLIWGVFCGIANGWPVASTLAQMAVPWIWVAAFVGYRGPESTRQAALLGGVTLLIANVAYFGVGLMARSVSGISLVGNIPFLVLWTGAGLVIGPVAGMIGWWLRGKRTALTAVVLLATVSIAEPLALWAHIDHLDAHLAYAGVAIAGLALPIIWFRSTWRRFIRAVALMLVLTYPTALTLEVALIALRQISAPVRLI